MDYGKFKFEYQKKQKEQRKKQSVVTVKEVRLSPVIDKGDFETKDIDIKEIQKDINDYLAKKYGRRIQFGGFAPIPEPAGEKIDEGEKEKKPEPLSINFEMKPEDVALFEPDGTPVEVPKKPSSETAMHLEVYRRRPDVNAVVHAHSVFATTIACMGWELPAVHYLVGFSGYKVPLAKYATYGTSELARNTADALGSFNAVLMANHGPFTVGTDARDAVKVAVMLEEVARCVHLSSQLGEPIRLDQDMVDALFDRYQNVYGQRKAAS